MAVETFRTELKPGDVGEISRLHAVVYAAEYGFDTTFESYVAGPLSEFASRAADRERIFVAEHDGRIVGCAAIVAAGGLEAQLRWFLVDPAFRGRGLGRRLLDAAVAFARGAGYETIFLWTVSALEAAARLYRAAGFERVESDPRRLWGIDVVEERYQMRLNAGGTPRARRTRARRSPS